MNDETIRSNWQFRLCKNRISGLQELTTMYSLLNLWALGAPIIRFLKLFTFTSVSSSNFPLSSRDSWLNRSSPRLIDLLMSCWKKAPKYKFLTHYMLHQSDLHYTGPTLRDSYCNSSIQTLQTTKEWSIQQGIRHILMKVQRCSNLDDASMPSMFLQRQSHQCQNLESFLRLSWNDEGHDATLTFITSVQYPGQESMVPLVKNSTSTPFLDTGIEVVNFRGPCNSCQSELSSKTGLSRVSISMKELNENQ